MSLFGHYDVVPTTEAQRQTMRFEKQTWGVLVLVLVLVFKPIPVAAWSKALVCGCSLGLRFRISPAAWMFVCIECCVLSGRGLCVRLITRPEDS
jgi:hypothetical protein